jgi:hypothetical protein
MCKKCAYPLKETKDISVSVRIHKFGRQATGGGDGGYDDFQEGTSSGYGGFSGYGYGGGGYGGGNDHDEDDEEDEDDDDEEGSDDEEASDEDDDDEYGAGGGDAQVGMAALNIKEFKIEGGGGSSSSTTHKGKSTK